MSLSSLLNRAIACQNAGRFSDALDELESSLSLYPGNQDLLYVLAGCCSNYAADFLKRGEIESAIEMYQKAIVHRPDLADIYYNLGTLYLNQGDAGSATSCYQDALNRDPLHGPANYSLANVYKRLGQIRLAEDFYQRALAHYSRPVDVLSSWGQMYLECAQYLRALELFQDAYRRDDIHIPIILNLTYVLAKLGDYKTALQICQHGLLAHPDDPCLLSVMISLHSAQGKGDLTTEWYDRISTQCIVDQKAVSLLLVNTLYNPSMSPTMVMQYHRQLAAVAFSPQTPLRPFLSRGAIKSSLRIGYLSPDFRTHSVSYFFEPILDHYDRSRFSVTCYTCGTLQDSATSRLRQKPENWVDVHLLSDEQAARRIVEDQIDILVDLAGHTNDNRLGIFAFRPAPVSVTYLGYPATTGLATMDYRITDHYADPIGRTEMLHTETLMRLPHSQWCYRPPDTSPSVQPPRTDLCPIVLGSFNVLAKLNRGVVAIWAQIMGALPDSTLLIKNNAASDAETQRYIRYLFKKQGVDPDRLKFVGMQQDHYAHMEYYNKIDIALDPFPYNGTTTTFEALWMGVPVITLAGESHVSRVGVSILTNLGRPEWIANTQEDYVAKVLALASDRPALMGIKQTLRQQLQSSSLMDGVAFVRDFETALTKMWGPPNEYA